MSGVLRQSRGAQPPEEKPPRSPSAGHRAGQPGGDKALAFAFGAPPIVADTLRSPGEALEPALRGEMESDLGHDLSRVRVHSDSKAAAATRAVESPAFTVGRNVVLGTDAPGGEVGRRLLRHELVHVLQQGFATGRGEHLAVGTRDSPAERQ